MIYEANLLLVLDAGHFVLMDLKCHSSACQDSEYLVNVEPVFRKREVQRDRVQTVKLLGSGHFGVVYEGRLLTSENPDVHTEVAVKTVKGEHIFTTIIIQSGPRFIKSYDWSYD